jgi:hypothetical protein
MADSPHPLDTDADSGAGAHDGATAYPGTPRWVKVSGIVAIGLLLLVVLLVVATALGLHTPGGPMGHGR